MLTRLTRTIMNDTLGDYLVEINYDNILEVSCRDEFLDTDSRLVQYCPMNTIYYLDVVLNDSENKMIIPFGTLEDRQMNQDNIHFTSTDMKYRDLHKGFYSKPKSNKTEKSSRETIE